MKKSVLIIMFILLLTFVSAESTTYRTLHFGNKAVANIVSYSPLPASPGHYFDLHVKLQNLDGSDISDVRLELVEEFPFSIYSGDNGPLITSLRRNEQILLMYRIKVDEKVAANDNPLRLRYVTPNGQWVSEPFDISVEELEAVLTIDSVKLEPNLFNQGEVGKVTLSLHNYASTFLKDITLDLDIDESEVFTPVGSTTEKKINALSGGEVRDVSFDLIVNADASSKAYKVPLNIKYYDSAGTEMTKTDYVGVLVGAKPDYRLDMEDTEVFTSGSSGDVVVSISNVGASEMKYVALELQESDDYDVILSNRVQLGNLDSDDFETAQFKIYAKSSKSFPLKLNVIYNDAYNKKYVDAQEVVLSMFSSREAVRFGLKEQGGSLFNVVFVLILLLFVYRVYKRRKIDKDTELAVKHVARVWYKYWKKKIANLIFKRRWG